MTCRIAQNAAGEASKQRAFTLIEMLVSLAIVSAIVTMVYGSYAATSRSIDVYGRRMDSAERAQLALRMMARQIRCAYMPPAATDATSTGSNRTSEATGSAGAFQAEPHGLRTDILSFNTTGAFGVGLDRPLGIWRVAYRYDQSQATLLISCVPCVYGPDSLQETGVWRPILTGVTQIEMAFHDGRQWQPRWDSKQSRRLPQAVRIALTVTGEDGRVLRYETTVSIVCRTARRMRETKTPVEKL